MLKYFKTLFLFFLLTACEENFDVHLSGKSLPVVYGVYKLNFREVPFHGYYLENPNYISLTRSFLGGQNAYITAKITDSLYFNNANVKIEYCFQSHVVGTTTLEKTTDFQKEPGLFSSSGNIIYQTTKHYVPRYFDTLRLIIDTGHEGGVYTSETQYVSSPRITFPVFHPERQIKFGFYLPDPFYLEWIDYGGYYETQMIINYFEVKNREITVKKLVWERNRLSNIEEEYFFCDWFLYVNNYTYQSRYIEPSRRKLFYPGDEVAFFLGSQISIDPNVSARKVKSIDFIVTATSKVLYDYMKFGINIQDNGNIYSNINNGIGIFATTCTDSINGIIIDRETVDSFANGRFTKHLNFVTYDIGLE
ncbi:hypothetical protein ACFLSY_10370 [Bacteroidota bacterium]